MDAPSRCFWLWAWFPTLGDTPGGKWWPRFFRGLGTGFFRGRAVIGALALIGAVTRGAFGRAGR